MGLGLLLASCAPEDLTHPEQIGILASTTGTTATLGVINGWDAAANLSLVQAGAIPDLYVTDLEGADVEGGSFVSLDFSNISTTATVSKVVVRAVMFIEVEAGDPTIGSRAMLQAGGGSLARPFIAMQTNEGTEVWGAYYAIHTAALVNDLKFVVRNKDLGGKKTRIDRVHVVVTHKEP